MTDRVATASPLFAELSKWGDKNFTGSFHVQEKVKGDARVGRVYMYQGRVYAVQIDGYLPRVGQRLKSAGVLTPDRESATLAQFSGSLLESGVGKFAVEQGWIAVDVLNAVHREFVLAGLGAIARWTPVTIKRHRRETTNLFCTVPIAVPNAYGSLAKRADETAEAWTRVADGVHVLTAVPVVTGDLPDSETTTERLALLGAVDGVRTVDEVAEHGGFTRFEAVHLLDGLAAVGVVTVTPGPVPAVDVNWFTVPEVTGDRYEFAVAAQTPVTVDVTVPHPVAYPEDVAEQTAPLPAFTGFTAAPEAAFTSGPDLLEGPQIQVDDTPVAVAVLDPTDANDTNGYGDDYGDDEQEYALTDGLIPVDASDDDTEAGDEPGEVEQTVDPESALAVAVPPLDSDAFVRWVLDAPDGLKQARLKIVRNLIRLTEDEFQVLVSRKEEALAAAEATRLTLTDKADVLADRQASLDDSLTQQSTLESDVAAAEQQRDAAVSDLTDAHARKDEVTGHIHDTQNEVDDLRARLQDAENRLQALTDTSNAIDGEIHQTQTLIDERQAQVDARTTVLHDHVTGTVTPARDAVVEAEQQVDDAQAAVTDAQATVDAVSREVEISAQSLDEAKRNVEVIEQRLAAA